MNFNFQSVHKLSNEKLEKKIADWRTTAIRWKPDSKSKRSDKKSFEIYDKWHRKIFFEPGMLDVLGLLLLF